MIPTSFNYIKAESVEEAISILQQGGQILGGGHSLVPTLKLRLNAPDTLVDISKIESLQAIRDNEKSITIGAGATHAAIAQNEAIAKHAPMMVQAAHEIGDIQVRNVGTIGGSMAHADPAADWPAALLASNASVVIQHPTGKREVDIDQFFKGFFETDLKENEIITAIRIPKTNFNKNSAYAKFKQPASRFAIVGCAVAADVQGGLVKELRVGLTGVAESAYRPMAFEKAMIGKAINEATIQEALAANSITEGVSILEDHYASEKYRAHLANVFVKRALLKL